MTEMESWIDRNNPKDVKWFIEKYNLNTPSRKRKVVFLRNEIARRLRHKTMLSFREIGILLNRDHSSVIICSQNANYSHRHKDKIYLDFIANYEHDLNQINYGN